MMPTGNEQEFDDLDLTTDLTDGIDGSAGIAGSEEATNVPDGSLQVERVAPVEPKTDQYSLRDQLSSAFKGDTPAEQETAPATTPTPLTPDAEGRYRRSDGTFASAEEVQTFLNSQQQETTNLETLLGQLPSAVAEQIKSLPAETQQFVARTMEDLNGRAARFTEYEQMEAIIGPRREAWAQNGMNSVVAVNQLFALSDFASTNPGDFVLWFADNNGIDLDALLDARDAAQSGVAPEVQELRNQVAQLQNAITQQQPQPQNDNLRIVETFAREKDDKGTPLRPYLPEVMPIFAHHVAAVRAANPSLAPTAILAKAYEAACWADPNVRIKMQAEADRQRREAAKQRANSLKNASSTIKGGPNGNGTQASTQGGNLSLRDELKAQFAAFNG